MTGSPYERPSLESYLNSMEAVNAKRRVNRGRLFIENAILYLLQSGEKEAADFLINHLTNNFGFSWGKTSTRRKEW